MKYRNCRQPCRHLTSTATVAWVLSAGTDCAGLGLSLSLPPPLPASAPPPPLAHPRLGSLFLLLNRAFVWVVPAYPPPRAQAAVYRRQRLAIMPQRLNVAKGCKAGSLVMEVLLKSTTTFFGATQERRVPGRSDWSPWQNMVKHGHVISKYSLQS
jgi:hypothetical protein